MPDGRVLIAFDDGPLEPDPTWTRIDDTDNLVSRIEIDTGRQDELDETKTGTAIVFLNDTGGLFDADNAGSPYFGKIDGKQILLQLWDPVGEEWCPRFRGIIDDYGYDLNPATRDGVSILSNIQVSCVDVFDYLAGVDLLPGVHGDPPFPGAHGMVFYNGRDLDIGEPGDGEVDTRIIAILTDVGIDPDMYVVFSGNVDVQPSTYDPGEKALVALRDAADAEFPGIANIYVDRFGRFCFHGRGARIDPDTVAGDAGPDAWDFQRRKAGDGAAILSDPPRAQIRPPLKFARSRSRLINAALTTYVDVPDSAIPSLVVSDGTSIAAYGVHSETWTELIIAGHKTNGNEAYDECYLFSTFWVENFKEPRTRVEALTFKALRPDGTDRASATWDMLCRCDISDVVDLKVGSPGGVGVDEPFFVEGWTQTITPLIGSDTDGWHDMVELSLNVSPTAYYTTNVFDD